MNTDQLLELLDIDTPEEFEYFEHIAELLESPENITEDAFLAVLTAVEKDTLTQLIENYFDDILSETPDEDTEFYALLLQIKQNLVGLAASSPESDQRTRFALELYRFRLWYAFDSVVYCKNKTGGSASEIPVFEALALCRLEKLGEGNYSYDFSEALGYPLDEYVMTLPLELELAEDDLEDYEDYEEEETLAHKFPLF